MITEKNIATSAPSRYNTASHEVDGHRLLYNSQTQNLVKVSTEGFTAIDEGRCIDPEFKRLDYLVDVRMDELSAAISINERQRSTPTEGLSVTIVPSFCVHSDV